MNVIVAVGKKKTGKTTWVKQTALSFPAQKKIVFDPNMHYVESGFSQYPDSDKKNAIEDFLQKIVNVKNAVIVIEEATINFQSASRQQELQSLLVRCRHQNNVLFLCFHSLRSLPTWIFDLIDGLKLFKTMDTKAVLNKFEGVDEIERAFEKVNYFSSDKHKSEFISFV